MPNRDLHLPAGAVAGVAHASYRAWGQPGPHLLAEATGGLVGGIDTPCSLRHRGEAHSMGITGTLGYFVNSQLPAWQESLRNEAQHYVQLRAASPFVLPQIAYGVLELILRFLAGGLAGLLAGYASHLALDSLTPSALPILC